MARDTLNARKRPQLELRSRIHSAFSFDREADDLEADYLSSERRLFRISRRRLSSGSPQNNEPAASLTSLQSFLSNSGSISLRDRSHPLNFCAPLDAPGPPTWIAMTANTIARIPISTSKQNEDCKWGYSSLFFFGRRGEKKLLGWFPGRRAAQG